MKMELQPGVYDWAKHEGPIGPVRSPQDYVELDDESLRDGPQGQQLREHPPINNKKIYLAMMSGFGFIDHADIAIPASDPKLISEAGELIEFTMHNNLPITLSIAGRGGLREDISPIIGLSDRYGIPLEADIFLDPTKLRAEKNSWDRDEMIGNLKKNILDLKAHGLKVMYVPERSTSAPPDELFEVCQIAADLGVDRICIADTTGVATDKAVRNIFRWSFEEIGKHYPDIKWDFHEHNDRGLQMGNCLAASDEGVNRLHGTMHDIGERVGNPNLLVLNYNLTLEGFRHDNLVNIGEAADVSARLFDYKPPHNTPVYGDDAPVMVSGIHTDTGVKELRRGETTNIYFVTPPEAVGRKPIIKVGPLSGKANAEYVLGQLGFENPSKALMADILTYAKDERKVLTDDEIKARAEDFLNRENTAS